LGEACAFTRGVPMQAFFVKHHRDSKAGLLDKELLDGIGEFGHPFSRLAEPRFGGRASGITGSADLADAMTVFESSARLGEVEFSIGIDQLVRLLLPDAHHLRRLFLQCHAG
jgi:hypothetical protein